MENQNTEQSIPEVQSEQSQTPPSLPGRDPGRLNDRFKLPKLAFLGIVFVFLICIVGGAYFLGRNSVFKELNPTVPLIPPADPVVYEPTPAPTSSPSADTSSWKTYSNSAYGFGFKYPDGVILEDKSVPNIAQVILAAQGFRETTISANRNDLSEYYLDTAPSGKITIGGLSGNKYYLPEGYCDGPTCSSPILAVSIVKNGARYVFSTSIEKGNDSFTDLENQILSTFKFN